MLKLLPNIPRLYIIGQIGSIGERVEIVLNLAYWRGDRPLRQVWQKITSARTSLQRYSFRHRTMFAYPAVLTVPCSD